MCAFISIFYAALTLLTSGKIVRTANVLVKSQILKPGQLYPNSPCVSTERTRISKESIIESVNQSISE